jgi:hypothetical protein
MILGFYYYGLAMGTLLGFLLGIGLALLFINRLTS